jgi:hypothetical protein
LIGNFFYKLAARKSQVCARNYLVFFSLDLKEEEMGYKIESVFIMVGIVSCLVSVAHAAQGNAVFYDPPYTRKL